MPSCAKLRRTGRADRSTSRMISSFSAAGYLMRRPPQPRSRFFSEAGSRASARQPPPSARWPPAVILHLVRGRRSGGVAGQALLAGFQKFLRPTVIEVLHYPLAPTQLGDAVLAAQSGKYDPDLLLGRELAPGGATDLFDNLLRRFLHRPGFLPHLRSFNGYDGPEILPSSTQQICLRGADAGHPPYWESKMSKAFRLRENTPMFYRY